MKRFFSMLIRLTTFFGKEMAEVLRQPRLILGLVFGPFLIMLLFGLGYRSEQPPLRTIFVARESSILSEEIQKNAQILKQLDFRGLIQDKEQMLRDLAARRIDMGVVVPDDAYNTVKSNNQATFEFYHNEIDPMQIQYMNYLAQIYVEEVNRRVLTSMAAQGQSDATSVQGELDTAIAAASATRQALENGDVATARARQADTRRSVSSVEALVGSSISLLASVDESTGGTTGDTAALRSVLDETSGNPTVGDDYQEGKADYNAEIASARKLEEDLTQLKGSLAEFTAISPGVLTRPFVAETKTITELVLTPMGFFTPGVVVLLLQHVTITLAALSIVRERRSGTMELFRASPIRAAEILFGKYVSYMVIGSIIGAILIALVVFGLRVPLLGSWTDLALVLLALMFASLGVGFVISLIASTESQAVQFSMIALLLSVFFSGFFLDLRYLTGPVKVVSYLIPATYGIQMLQNIMLRGMSLVMPLMINLLIIGGVVLILSWLLLGRQMRHE